MLISTGAGGCAALDLLGGHLPGQEDEPAVLVEPEPYPAPRRIANRRFPTSDRSALASEAPAPIVSATKAAESPAKMAANSAPARASLTDDPAEQPAAAARAETLPPAPAVQPAVVATEHPAVPASEKPVPPAQVPFAEPAGQAAAPAAAVADAASGEGNAAAASAQAGQQSAAEELTPEKRLAALLERRDELIALLEDEVKLRGDKQDPSGELPRLQQQLRILYLLADRPDDAVGEIDSLPAAEQEAFKQLMFGLGTWLSQEEDRRPNLRNARVLRSFKDAAGHLAAAAKLDVRNLRFCEGVEGFGWYKEFPTAQFRPKQQVILYAEVENFATEKKGADTFETELQASYQIFDASGAIVDERQLPLDKETCRNQRRDYFLAYRIYLPEGVEGGRYRLELTVEDLKAKEHYQGRKLGSGLIEFSIRP